MKILIWAASNKRTGRQFDMPALDEQMRPLTTFRKARVTL